jgi:hypothetical protein
LASAASPFSARAFLGLELDGPGVLGDGDVGLVETPGHECALGMQRSVPREGGDASHQDRPRLGALAGESEGAREQQSGGGAVPALHQLPEGPDCLVRLAEGEEGQPEALQGVGVIRRGFHPRALLGHRLAELFRVGVGRQERERQEAREAQSRST